MTETAPNDLSITTNDHVRTIAFDRPAVLNAIRNQTLDELLAAVSGAHDDEGIRVLVLTGTGDAFSAGQDLDELAHDMTSAAQHTPGEARDRYRAALERTQNITRRLLDNRCITIAAINGVAVGFGAELAVNCDIRLGTATTRIGFVEARRALGPTNGVFHLLPRLVGGGAAADLLLSGDIIDVDDAMRLGLLTRRFDDDFTTAVDEFAASIASNAPISIDIIKTALRATWTAELDETLETEIDGMIRCLESDDLTEGNRAFAERRTPEYSGR